MGPDQRHRLRGQRRVRPLGRALARRLQLHLLGALAARRLAGGVPAGNRPCNSVIASLPGFGERTAAVMATYLPASFEGWGPRKKIVARVQALFGCDPRLRQSGQWVGNVKISKRGIAAGRTALFQAAFCSLERDEENAAYYRALRDDGREHKAAIVDLMRKQVRRLVAVLCNNRPFVPSVAAPHTKPRTQSNPSRPKQGLSPKSHTAA